MSGTRKAFELLRNLPRVCLENIKGRPTRERGHKVRTRKRGQDFINPSKTAEARQVYTQFEHVMEGIRVYHTKFPSQPFNNDYHLKTSYIPMSLHSLQLLVDTDRVRCNVPIDVTQIALTGIFIIDPQELQGGIILEDEGMDYFSAPVNIEVQHATEPIIAAIERAGGTITTAYYDPVSLEAAISPEVFFKKGIPIPKRLLPPQRLMKYYCDPKHRGYLADPDEIAEERFLLAQKYGYELPDLSQSPNYSLLMQRKDPRQIFYGLSPGWIVNLKEKQILKPTDPNLKEYYNS